MMRTVKANDLKLKVLIEYDSSSTDTVKDSVIINQIANDRFILKNRIACSTIKIISKIILSLSVAGKWKSYHLKNIRTPDQENLIQDNMTNCICFDLENNDKNDFSRDFLLARKFS